MIKRSKRRIEAAAADDERILALVRAHGPITFAQFAARSGLTVADVRDLKPAARAINNALARLKRAGAVEYDRTLGWSELRLCQACGGSGRAR